MTPKSASTDGHNVVLFLGPKAVLRPFAAVAQGARAYALQPSASLFVVPLTDEVHEALHRANGTGEWLALTTASERTLLTTTDVGFAAHASKGSALAWIATGYQGHEGWQAAAVWIDGATAMKPTLLEVGENRPQALAPINTALRLMGINTAAPPQVTQPAWDEFAGFGLGRYRSNEAIAAHAMAVPI